MRVANFPDPVRTALAAVGLAAGILATNAGAAAVQEQTPEEAPLRPYASGAGPAAIFRYGRDAAKGYDIFGVVDPVYWRIRFFVVEDARPGGKPLRGRIAEKGDCLLPPTFRIWRVHQFEDRIVLQSQPEMSLKTLTDETAELSYRKIVLPVDRKHLTAAISGGVTPADQKPRRNCGGIADFDAPLPVFDTDRDSSEQIVGGAHREFSLRRRRLSARAPAFLRRPIHIAQPGHYLASAQELEPARACSGDVDTGSPATGSPEIGHGCRSDGAVLRYFLITSRVTGGADDRPGFIDPVVTLVRRGASGRERTMRLNLGLTRVKTGQRFAAISSVGEVLLIGGADQTMFKFFSCTFAQAAASRCTTSSEPLDASAGHDDLPVRGAHPAGKRLPGRWEDAVALANRVYWVDAGSPAEDGKCVSVSACPVGIGRLRWLPPMDLRLAAGVRKRIGVPYAQSASADGRPWIGSDAASFPAQGATASNPIRLKQVKNGRAYLFGDIENSEQVIGSKAVSVFGIDCSALVSQMWERERLTTSQYIRMANAGMIERVASIGHVKMDDAFVINVEGMLNHIAIFRETRPAGRFDSSRAILVLESSSTCGGMCFSFYDESFFLGWAIIRNGTGANRFARIPTDFPSWRAMFAQ